MSRNLNDADRQILRNVARGWAAVGVLPCETAVVDRGFGGVVRPCVEISFAAAFGSRTLFFAECDTIADAERLSGAVEARLEMEYDAIVARLESERCDP